MEEEVAKEFDVIIIGAGPAGSTCALALADSGLRVAMIDKSSFPRNKVCGDAVAAYVPKVLATISVDLRESLVDFQEKVKVNTCRLVAPNQKTIDLQFKEEGMISRRLDFDNFLFEKASAQHNVTVSLNNRVEDVIIDSAGVSVHAGETRFKCSVVIGCDGAHSVINRKITGAKPDPAHHCAAVRTYYRSVSGMTDNTFEIHMLSELLPGYFWIFPVKNELANVGLGILSSEVSRRRLDLRSMLPRIISENPYLSERFTHARQMGNIEGFGLPLGSRRVTMSGDRFMLCGDAASLIDPLSGEGIGQAIVSGRYAGWHARKCFERKNFSAAFMKKYDEEVLKKFWSRHRRNYLIQKLAKREWLLNFLFATASKSAAMNRIMKRAFE